MDEKLSMPPPGIIPQPRRLPLPPSKNPTSKVFSGIQTGVPDGKLNYNHLLLSRISLKLLTLILFRTLRRLENCTKRKIGGPERHRNQLRNA